MGKRNFLVNIDFNQNEILNSIQQNLASHPSSPKVGQTYFNTSVHTPYVYAPTNPNSDGNGWLDMGSLGITNLAYTASATNGIITSSTGTDATIPVADASNAGLLAPADYSWIHSNHDGEAQDAVGNILVDSTTIDFIYNSSTPSITANVKDNSITYAKIQNASGNNILLGNDNGAGNDLQELSASAVLTLLSLDANLQTFSLPANTTISTFGKSLVETANAAAARTILDVDQSGTDNSVDVTLTGTPDYITISGQIITRHQIDLATDVTGTLPIANLPVLDEDNLGSDSDTHIPTQQSVKAYVDNKVAGASVYMGGYNANTNTPNLDSSPTGVNKGYTYTVTDAGTFYTEDVQIGDVLIAEVDNPSSLSDWTLVNKNIPDIVDSSETAKGIIELATQAEVDAGTDTVRAVTPATLQAKLSLPAGSNLAKKIAFTIGDGSALSYTVTHNFATRDVTVQVYRAASPYDVIECEIKQTNTNSTTLSFNTAPTTNEFRVVIIG